MSALLVVAGEASGDAWAAAVVRRLGVPSFGLGGPGLAAAGTELVADLRAFSAMGLAGAARAAPAVAGALLRLVPRARSARPRAALLVGFSEVNARLAPWLRSRGAHVVWYAPPQVWAWRPRRARRLAQAADRLAVILPFEERLWRAAGAEADYVGHPALEHPPGPAPGSAARDELALLPGSRRHEIRAHLPVFLHAAARLAARGGLRPVLVLSPSLDGATQASVEGRCARVNVRVTRAPLPEALRGARVALVASGTATLECAALSVPPVVVYRTDPLTYAAARRVVRIRQIGLPNIVLGREAYPELVQGAATSDGLVRAAERVLGDPATFTATAAELRHALATSGGSTPSERVAQLLSAGLPA